MLRFTTTPATPAAVLALAALVGAGPAAAASGRLTLYTSQPQQDAQQTVDAFRKAVPGLEVDWIRDGTTQVLAKLRAEFAAGQPKPDLLLIADVVTMQGLKRDGRLLAHPAAPVAGYDEKLYDPDMTYFGTKLITTGIVYNTRAAMKPQSWADLAKPEAKGQVSMPSPLTSGAALIHVAMLTSQPGLGWGYFEALAKNGAIAQGGNGNVLKDVAGGQRLYGMLVEFMALREKAKGAPIDFVFPQDGVSSVTEPVAILKTAANPAGARAFVDFLLSKEGQELAARQGYMPMHPAVQPPAGFPKLADIRLLPLDAAGALANEEANKKHFEALFAR
ncbi:MAG: ABC transporter substrate-binding protein [Thalassobaculales bacterium]